MKTQSAAVMVRERRSARQLDYRPARPHYGCKHAASCLTCPLVVCKFDPRGLEVELRLRAGESDTDIVDAMGSTHQHVLAAYRDYLRLYVPPDRAKQSTPRPPDRPHVRAAPCLRPHCGGTMLSAGKTQHCGLCARPAHVIRRTASKRNRARRNRIPTGSRRERRISEMRPPTDSNVTAPEAPRPAVEPSPSRGVARRPQGALTSYRALLRPNAPHHDPETQKSPPGCDPDELTDRNAIPVRIPSDNHNTHVRPICRPSEHRASIARASNPLHARRRPCAIAGMFCPGLP